MLDSVTQVPKLEPGLPNFIYACRLCPISDPNQRELSQNLVRLRQLQMPQGMLMLTRSRINLPFNSSRYTAV